MSTVRGVLTYAFRINGTICSGVTDVRSQTPGFCMFRNMWHRVDIMTHVPQIQAGKMAGIPYRCKLLFWRPSSHIAEMDGFTSTLSAKKTIQYCIPYCSLFQMIFSARHQPRGLLCLGGKGPQFRSRIRLLVSVGDGKAGKFPRGV